MEEWNAFLKDLMVQPQSAQRDRIESRARSKMYHDFESPLAMPKMELNHDLRKAGYNDMAAKVLQGDYDF